MRPIQITDQKGEFFSILHTTQNSQIALMTLDPGSDSGAYGLHEGDQVVYCLEGEGEIEVGEERIALTAHEVFVIPAGQKHKIYNTGTAPLFFMNVYAPPAY